MSGPARTDKVAEYLICPHCNRVLDTSETVIGDHGPQAGDIAVCCHCAEVSIHVSPTLARKPTEEEAEILREDETIIELRMEILLDQPMTAPHGEINP